ncbi:MAG: FHA domain-containing protein, partial [Candidatus Eremiobacterota bacterium]
ETAAEEAPVAEIAAEEAEVLEPAEEEEELWICSKCNRENRGKSRFCSGCGESKIKEEGPVDDQGKPRVVYADLIIYDSKGNSKRVSLLNERITIGRVDPLAQIYPDIDLTFFDSEQIVSRRHCEIFQKPPGQYFLVDIGSSNGTFLNRKKIQKGVSLLLNDNDEVHFAKTRTIFSQSLD